MRWLILASLALAGCHRRPAPPTAPSVALAVVGDDAKLRRDEPLPSRSPIFDGTTVRLRGARGETLGLQVLTHGRARVALTLPPTVARVDGFRLRYLEVRDPSTAMYGGSRGAGAWPDPLEPAALPVAGDALFDVVIAADAPPGLQRGALTVDGRAIAVELTVERLRLDVAAAPLVWIWYQPGEIARAHGLADEDAALLPLERRYHALARAHGAYFASDLPPARFEARVGLMAGTRYWPVRLDDGAPAAVLRAAADGWDRRFARLPQTAFTIPVDEPQTAAARAEARRLGEAIGPHAKLLRAVTAAPAPDLAGAIDVFLSPASRPPHRWTYNGAPPSAGSLVIDTDGTALRTWGWIALRYGVELWHVWEGTYFADRYNGGGATRVLEEPLTFDQRRKPLARPDWGNGDGVLVYPGAGPGRDGPWPSLRLKALRRGLQDRALMQALIACGVAEAVDRELRALVPRALDEARGAAAWPADSAAWDAARGRLYDAWRARCAHE